MTWYPLPLIIGWALDRLFGDPERLPHPIVWFGRMIAFGEHRLNRGSHRKLKGAIVSIVLILTTFGATCLIRDLLTLLLALASEHSSNSPSILTPSLLTPSLLTTLFDTIIVFYCLAGTTLIREVRQVFLALDESLEKGRRQVSRIVGRDTSQLTAQEVRTAALETLAENLSDGVTAPLFWLALLGTPGMLAYKMVNTLDSMIGYKTERFKDFGCVAAHIDDVVNYLPARLTALLMVIASGRPSLWRFVHRYGHCHASPNSGYPEAALAGILDCRFGGPHYYFGEYFDKPYIGSNDRILTTADMQKAVRINQTAEVVAVILTACLRSIW